MTLRLSIENVASLTSGDPVEVTLEQHGMIIGRAAHADWTLPDPKNFISSIHCEIDYQGGRYFLTDRSTNGTFINGSTQRFTKPYQLRDGDLVAIGSYQVRVEEVPEEGAGHDDSSPFAAAPDFAGGLDWGAGAGAASKPIDARKFGREPPKPLFQSASDPLMNAFAMPGAGGDPFGTGGGGTAPSAFGGGDPFGLGGGGGGAPAAAPATPDPFGLAGPSTPAPAPVARPAASQAAPSGDPFGFGAPPQRGTVPPPHGDPFGFAGAPPAAPAGADPFGIAAAPPPAAYAASPPPAAATADPWAKLHGQPQVDFAAAMAPAPPPVAAPAAAPRAVTAAPPARSATAAPGEAGLFDKLLAATGIKRADLGDASPEAVVEAAGQLLRQAADGLIRLLDARTRVRHQFGVGASVTTFQRAGNNPLKWTRSPEQALKQMIGAPDPGFLPGAQAVRGAFEDLQAHELAMIAAMQEAMQATIERFAPDKIKERISARGWLKSVLPGSREATLWRAYETEFRAFADETEAAYLDLFAKHFKKAYERTIAKAGPG